MKNFAFDATFLSSIACDMRGNYSHVMNLRPLGNAPAYFDYGELGHYFMRYYYGDQAEGITKSRAREHAFEECRKFYPQLDLPVEECEEVLKTCNEYAIYYQNDTWKPTRTEAPFTVKIFEDESFQWADGEVGLTLAVEGVIDLEVITENGNVTLVDHKFISRNKDPEKLANQFMLYCYAFDRRSIIINHIGKQKTLKPKDKFQRFQRFYGKELLTEFMQESIEKVIRFLRRTETGYYPHDYTSCDKFNGCSFRQICEQDPKQRESIIRLYYKESEPWDPWKRR
jgi:hypothetical protein